VGQRVRQVFEHRLRRLARRQLRPRTGQRLVARGLAMRAQALEGCGAGTGGGRLHEPGDLDVDDRLGLDRGLASAAAVVLDRALQVVHRVQEHVVDTGDVGGDVARYREVQQQHRPVPALGQRLLHLRAVQYRLPTGGGRQHYVGLAQVLVEFGQRQRNATVAAGQFLRVRERAVRDQQPSNPCLDEMAGRQFDGLAGADQQHGRVLEPGERLLRQAHRDGGHRHRVRTDAGVGAGALGGRESLLEQTVELAAKAAGAARGGPGVLDLAQDLRLAQHQRVQPGRDPEQVAHRVAAGVPVQVAVQALANAGGVGRVGRQPVGQRAAVVVGDGVDLGAVAGRQQRGFMHPWQCPKRRQRRHRRIAGKRDALAQADRRGLVVEAEDVDGHGEAARLPVQVLAISCWLLKAAILPALPTTDRSPMPATARSFIGGAVLVVAMALPAIAPQARTPPSDDPVVRALEPLLAAEFAIQSGRLDDAARWYLEAARAADDIELAERATRVALLARDDARAAQALELWRAQGGAGQRLLAAEATLALRSGETDAARRHLTALLASPANGWREALAVLAGGAGDPDQAAALLEDLVDSGHMPAELQAWLAFGGLAQRLEQPALAERLVAEVV